MLPLWLNERPSSSQLLNQPADQVIRPPAAVPESRAPTMCDSTNVDAVVITERSMNGTSRPFSIISRPTPSFCLPRVNVAKSPRGMPR